MCLYYSMSPLAFAVDVVIGIGAGGSATEQHRLVSNAVRNNETCLCSKEAIRQLRVDPTMLNLQSANQHSICIVHAAWSSRITQSCRRFFYCDDCADSGDDISEFTYMSLYTYTDSSRCSCPAELILMILRVSVVNHIFI